MADSGATSAEEVVLSALGNPYTLRKPMAATATEASDTANSETLSKPTAKASANKNEENHEITTTPPTRTRTAPYSALPFHRPYSTVGGWGKHEGQIPDPLKVGEALAIQNPTLSEVDFMKIAKVYSGAYTFGLCIVTVVGLVLLKWMWNGCRSPDDYRYAVGPKEKEEKWWQWF